jgi:hypothetical protein
MRWLCRSGLVASALAVGISVAAAPAQAAPPKNSGWVTLPGDVGAAFFDADLAGSPSSEKITVCDNKANSRAVIVTVYGDNYGAEYVIDPSSNGQCTSIQGNMFPDGYGVDVYVSEYKDGTYYGQAVGYGVA